jgi:hypothetical protein
MKEDKTPLTRKDLLELFEQGKNKELEEKIDAINTQLQVFIATTTKNFETVIKQGMEQGLKTGKLEERMEKIELWREPIKEIGKSMNQLMFTKAQLVGGFAVAIFISSAALSIFENWAGNVLAAMK